ncbi:MAG TPA: xanthine dehydrogenase family protein subunit M [Bauldia sp.]|nr:xanthine dehydrogenase family protein subunit M [Bauldia sp.]
MYETRYHRPSTLAEARALFNADARYIAGGQTLLPTMKQRLAAPTDLIDIARLAELKGISVANGVVSIGGGTTHAEVAASDAVRKAIPALAALAALIGDPAVRHMGTIGGSLANNDPAADYAAAVLALGATIHTDQRAIPADDFIRGLFATALEDGEIIVRVDFPVPDRAAYEKFRNPASRYALAATFIAKGPGGIRVAVTGAGNNGAFRAAEIERALSADWSPAAIDAVTIDPATMLGDIHATPAYRANLVKVTARRALAKA